MEMIRWRSERTRQSSSYRSCQLEEKVNFTQFFIWFSLFLFFLFWNLSSTKRIRNRMALWNQGRVSQRSAKDLRCGEEALRVSTSDLNFRYFASSWKRWIRMRKVKKRDGKGRKGREVLTPNGRKEKKRKGEGKKREDCNGREEGRD